ncbi:hypothetical protein BDN70DRAFT_931371 [Pholiota conissans]|uniref:DUF6697 domain-containing protein n=1 Tax=Pholiota conissans TaxID=109636 RepID=A0A9P5Z4D8_9AGAR|nr:hypothetical protein BDN70DRAFT_931371 [Pholiota conissans]
MSNLNLSDTENRIQSFQSRLRSDYAAKIQEVAKLTDVVAKLQTQLLDVEYENNVLRQELVTAKKEIDELRKGKEGAATNERGVHLQLANLSTSTQPPTLSLKRERSPSLDINWDIPSKKVKGLERAERPDKAAFLLPKNLIREYLQEEAAIPVSPSALAPEVPRLFLKKIYGGNGGRLLASCGKNNPSGKKKNRHMVFADLELNPHMPSTAGTSGIVLAFPIQISTKSPWSLFCARNIETGRQVCTYTGEYKTEFVGKMTAQCFREQSYQTKLHWARQILNEGKRFNIFRVIRARIALRLASVIPIEHKAKNGIVKKEALAIKKGKGLPLSEDNIITAFSNEEEQIDIFRMTCVNYDHVFANDIKTRFAKESAPKGKTGKRKNRPINEGGADEEEEEEEEEKEEEAEEDGEDGDEDDEDDEDEEDEDEEDEDDEEVIGDKDASSQTTTTSVSANQKNQNIHALLRVLQAQQAEREYSDSCSENSSRSSRVSSGSDSESQ